MYTLADWLSNSGNMEKYKKWRDNEVTQEIIKGLRMENPPPSIPVNAINGEIALFIHGITVGIDRVFRRMMMLDERVEKPKDPKMNYGIKKSLLMQGLSEEEADQRLKEYQDGLI